MIVVTGYWAAIARMNAWYYLDVDKIDIRNERQDFFTSFFFTRLTSKGTEVCQIQYFYIFLPHLVK